MSADVAPQVLLTQAQSRGDHPLLICDSERISYVEAESSSAALAMRLVSLGIGRGSHVGLLYPNGAAFVVALLAAARIGAVVVPFPTFATASEIRNQLAHSDVRLLLAAEHFRAHDYRSRLAEALDVTAIDDTAPLFSASAPQLRQVLFGVPDCAGSLDESARRALARREDDVAEDDPLCIVYTSGSSGAPKGVVHTHAGLLGHQRDLNALRRLTSSDVLFCNSPFFWIGGLAFALLSSVLAGSTLVCSNATDPAATLDLLEAEKPTMTNGFVTGIAALSQHPSLADRDLSSMRRGNLYPIMAPQTRPKDPALRHGMLGMTETGGPVLLSDDPTDQPEHRRGSFGKPAPGFDCRIEDGELWVRGPYLMQRYYKRSREESFDADGWFHTGDLVRIDSDGFYYFLGRRDRLIKTAGVNVAPAEVERAIAGVTGGLVAHVFGIPDPDRGQSVAAVVVGNAADVDAKALLDQLRSHLSSYKIPRRVTTVAAEQVPLLASGKVDLRALSKVFDD